MPDQKVGVLGSSSLVGGCLLAQLEEMGWGAVAFSRVNRVAIQGGAVAWRQLAAPGTKGTDIASTISHWICVAPIWVLPDYFPLIETSGARRVVALSSTSRFTKVGSGDTAENAIAAKLIDAEARVQAWAERRGIEWVVLRPTLIYGQGRDKNISEMARFIRRFGFFPLLGSAQGLRQPIHAEDVAAACVAALQAPGAANRAYNLSGGETLAYREMVARVFAALGRPARLVTVPLWAFRLAVAVLRRLPRYRHWSAAMAERMALPPGVLLVVLDKYLTATPATYERKQALLRHLLRAGQPHAFHNINSEVAWHLIVSEGEHLKRYTRLYASIFAFQFAPDRRTKIGYAAYFLKKGMSHLAGLLSDNQRFLTDAAREYALSATETERMAVLYQPCRLLLDQQQAFPVGLSQQGRQNRVALPPTTLSEKPNRRPQVLWAGRLDAEKRIDLFLEVVRRCQFADFRVFGQVVLNDQDALPELPNLSYEGPFTSPQEWLDRYDFDAFVFTSRWEGMPNILLEVGALGIPVIASTVGGVIELIDETTGYPLPEQPEVADYEQALLQIIADPAQSLQRASKLQDLVRQRHGWSSFVAGVAALPDYLPPAGEITPIAVKHNEDAVPVVTVIIPCFNQGHYLEQSVVSALSACTEPMEILVVDDGSTDPNIARQLAHAEQLAPGVVRIHRQLNQGLSGARNSGIALAQGKYVQFLDADDLLTPGKMDAQIAQLEINPELDVSVCNYLLCDEERGMFTKTEEAIARFEIGEQDFLYRWERGFVIPIHAGVFRRSVLSQEHRFDTHARAKEDWLFWTNLSLAGARFGYVEGHWAIYRQHETSMRRSYVNMGLAWLQAGLKINEKVGHREPLFFESVVSWFEQCYRSNPSYRAEIARRQQEASSESVEVSGAPEPAEEPAVVQARREARAILEALSSLPPLHERPKISVVVPVYGHFGYLQNCLGSLANQGQAAFEIVCIDDGSPDPRVSLLMDELQDKHPRLIVHRELCNTGISSVQNLAVEMARGEFVAFLDCDDAFVPNALETVCIALQAMPEVDYLFTDRIDVDETGETIRIAHYGGYDRLKFKSQDLIAEDLLDGMVASHLKVIRRSVYQAVGGCEDKYSGVQDWDLALRIAQSHKLYYLAQPLYQHRVHKQSVTRRSNIAQLRKTNAVLRQHLERWRSLVAERPEAHIFKLADMPVPLEQLKRIWKQGGRCVADLTGKVDIGHINYMREFNAYFDQIIWTDPKVPAALFGYLCDRVQMRTLTQKRSELGEH